MGHEKIRDDDDDDLLKALLDEMGIDWRAGPQSLTGLPSGPSCRDCGASLPVPMYRPRRDGLCDDCRREAKGLPRVHRRREDEFLEEIARRISNVFEAGRRRLK
jgi:hypothetical protein